MGIEMSGTIHTIFETRNVSERFTKREFVIETNDNPKYPQLVIFQITGDKVSQLDELAVGDEVRIDFSVRGREWRSPSGEVKYFNSLDVWKVALIKASKPTTRGGSHDAPPMQPSSGVDDDIPFLTADMSAEPSPIARVLR